ncbi:MAG: hypothetical protein JXD23_09965 [Spirochaetales bacterium]|nr:hypothetical protein [Spirochaetales bacterium]
MSAKLIEYKGKKIIFADHRGLAGQELINSMSELNKVVIQNKYEYLLADFRDTTLSTEVMDYLRGQDTKEAIKCYKKQAIIAGTGKVMGIKKFAVNLYNTMTRSSIKYFGSEEEAKEYLIS